MAKKQSQPKKSVVKQVEALTESPVFSRPNGVPVLEQSGAGDRGHRLLDPSCFDEAAYHIPVPLVTASALRAYIERQARPLEKVIRIANGEEVNGHSPSWDDQREAIYTLVHKVAPDLRAVEVTSDSKSDPEGQSQTSKTIQQLVDGLVQLAHAKRGGQALPVTLENGDGPARVGQKG